MAYLRHSIGSFGLALPFRFVASLSGRTSSGKSTPEALVTKDGVFVGRNGVIECYSHDLKNVIWKNNVPTWEHVHDGPTFILFKEFDGSSVQFYEKADGTLLRSLTAPTRTGIQAVASNSFLLQNPEDKQVHVMAFDGRTLWTKKMSGKVLATDDNYFIVDMENRLYAFDESTGEICWTFQASADPQDWRANNIIKLVVVGNRVLVAVGNARLYEISKQIGKVINRAMRPATRRCLDRHPDKRDAATQLVV